MRSQVPQMRNSWEQSVYIIIVPIISTISDPDSFKTSQYGPETTHDSAFQGLQTLESWEQFHILSIVPIFPTSTAFGSFFQATKKKSS